MKTFRQSANDGVICEVALTTLQYVKGNLDKLKALNFNVALVEHVYDQTYVMHLFRLLAQDYIHGLSFPIGPLESVTEDDRLSNINLIILIRVVDGIAEED